MRAHREGILTTASLMVNEPAAEEAVALARAHPTLGVGLHLALLHGRAALPRERIPGLLRPDGQFSTNAVASGMRFFFSRALHAQIEAEILEQFSRFRSTGLRLDHVNGHLHIHLHPVVLGIVLRHAREWGVERLRLTRDPFWLNAQLSGGQWLYRGTHAIIYSLLSKWARRHLISGGLQFTEHVFGLLQNARVDECFVAKLLPALPTGDSELYSHPSLHEFKHELEALVSPRIKRLIREQDIQLIRYQDL